MSTSMNTVPPGWTLVQLGELVLSSANGCGRRRSVLGMPRIVLRLADVEDGRVTLNHPRLISVSGEEAERYALVDADLLVIRVNGSADLVGRFVACAGFDKPVLYCDHFIRLRLADPVMARFLRYMGDTQSVRDYVDLHKVCSAGQNTVSQRALLGIAVRLPPLVEQARIADRIDELFTDLAAGVAALDRVKRNLARYRAAVLHAAVTGGLTEAWRKAHGPPAEPGPKLLERILAERRRQWEDRTRAKYERAGKSLPKNWRDRYPKPLLARPLADGTPLPELPNGWCWATHDQVGNVQLGRQRSPHHHRGKHMRPYLRVANVYEDRIDTSNVLEMNFTPSEFDVYALRFGDVLLNEGQSIELVGRPAMYRDELPGGCFQNTLVRQRAFDGLLPEFALVVCRAQFRAGRFRKIASITTSIAHLGAQRFAALEFPLPPLAEQSAIVEAVNERLSQIDALEAEVERGLARAGRLRQAILKAAFEGKLVPQDPADEPASVLLERIRQQVAAAEETRTRKPRGKAGTKTSRKSRQSDRRPKRKATRRKAAKR